MAKRTNATATATATAVSTLIADKAPKALALLRDAAGYLVNLANIETSLHLLRDQDKSEQASLTLTMQKAIDVAQACGIKFATKIVNNEIAMDDRCAVRAEFWAHFMEACKDDNGVPVGLESKYFNSLKSRVNRVMCGLNTDLKDAKDQSAKRGRHAVGAATPKVNEPAPAKPATTVAAPSEPNPVVDGVAHTWNYMRTAPTHLAMMRSVIAKTETGMTLEDAIVDALNDYAKQLKKAMGK